MLDTHMPTAGALHPAAASSLAAAASIVWPNVAQTSSADDTARLFDSSKCRQMLDKVHSSGWTNVCGFSRAGLDLGQHTFRAQPQKGRDIYYVRNEKVASTFLVMELNALFNGTSIRNTRLQKAQFGAERRYWPFACEPDAEFPTAEQQPEHPVVHDPRKPVLFTVVRDPIKTAFDAYLEITKKKWYSESLQDDLLTELDAEMYSDFRLTHPHATAHNTSLRRRPTSTAPEPAWRRATCETIEKARLKFSMYLDALQARPRQDCGSIGYHAYPQAMKVNIVTRAAPRFDAIVKLEELNEGLMRVGALAGTPAVIVPSPTKGEAHSNDRLACANFGIGAKLTRRLCKLYAVDFECFGYELPDVCRR